MKSASLLGLYLSLSGSGNAKPAYVGSLPISNMLVDMALLAFRAAAWIVGIHGKAAVETLVLSHPSA